MLLPQRKLSQWYIDTTNIAVFRSRIRAYLLPKLRSVEVVEGHIEKCYFNFSCKEEECAAVIAQNVMAISVQFQRHRPDEDSAAVLDIRVGGMIDELQHCIQFYTTA